MNALPTPTVTERLDRIEAALERIEAKLREWDAGEAISFREVPRGK